MAPLLPRIEIDTADDPRAAVIWLHGLGADGSDFAPLVGELDLSTCPPIRFVFPDAPAIPVTLNGGYVMPAWYDIRGSALVREEDAAGIDRSARAIQALVDHEVRRGIPPHAIVLAGFSQGCAIRNGSPASSPCRATCRWPTHWAPSAARPTWPRRSSWHTASRTPWWRWIAPSRRINN